ncbi:exodeoxyribonuclease VII large subunit [Nitrosomonas sp. PY1]|uniref:exodeoxyribonuclease VII large subunit n=1 Tax=Nitrosomonas sp. PY1 TaxID=1803906 RepID=UPI001FC7DFE3|nr:exodeoxyribonuclease VII large subunit [Nitrosomonas sp. PY1]GKS69695.1 exodeoxyribonuclease VII large subunit [Nitrosomonas sp. PY1]
MSLPYSLENSTSRILTISELNRNTKQFLEQNIPLLWVQGEISNLKCYPSGHWYFSLKDNAAQIRCVFFNHKNYAIDWQLKDGMHIEALARVTIYEPRGDYQLNIETIRQAGLGKLYEAFERLKSKLENAGLFCTENKKTLSNFPKQVGIITSPNTAALRDVIATMQRRTPSLPIIIYPTLVQGKMAATEIAHAIEIACRRKECDVLILCRGGGSIEDLWAFNEEIVALAIANSSIPIVSGIGHETDFTIADFVADRRAPTPTGAAELIGQDHSELNHHLKKLFAHLNQSVLHQIERTMQKIDTFSYRLIYPGNKIQRQAIRLHYLTKQLNNTWKHVIEKKTWKLNQLRKHLLTNSPNISQTLIHTAKLAMSLNNGFSRYTELRLHRIKSLDSLLAQLNPQLILKRGYSITYNISDGSLIRSTKQIKPGDNIQVKFAHGSCEAHIKKISNV